MAQLNLARQLGSDVPFFLQVQPETLAVVGGTGEQLQWYSWDVPYEFLRSKLQSQIVNDFETVVFEQFPVLRRIKEQLLEHSLMIYAGLSGTGATVFGCTLDPECARSVAQRFEQQYRVIQTRQLAEQRMYV